MSPSFLVWKLEEKKFVFHLIEKQTVVTPFCADADHLVTDDDAYQFIAETRTLYANRFRDTIFQFSGKTIFSMIVNRQHAFGRK